MITFICQQAFRNSTVYRSSTSVLRTPMHAFLSKRAFKTSDIVLKRHDQKNIVSPNPAIRRYSTTTVTGYVIGNREKDLNDNQSRIQEEEMTEKEKDWTISEEDARPPKIIRPILFFLAIGTSAFYLAAFMNNRRNDDMIQFIKLNPTFIGNFSALYLSLPEKNYLEKLQNRYDSSNFGDTNVKWGDFTEAQLRSVKAKTDFVKANQFNFLDRMIHQISYSLGVPQISIAHQNIRVTITQLPDEMRVGIPIICTAAAVIVGVKLSKKDKLSKHTYAFVREHMMHTPAADRLYTLTTSIFTQKRLIDLVKYSPVFIFIGSASFLENKGISTPHIAETTTLYHFLAFCIAAGTFANVFSNVFIRVFFQITKHRFGTKIATKLIGRKPEMGLGGMAYGLMATYAFPLENLTKLKSIDDIDKPLICFGFISLEAILVSLSLFDRRFAYGTERISRLGGAIFGFFYGKFGSKFWEKEKSLFIEESEQTLKTNKTEEDEKRSKFIEQPSPQIENA